MLPSRPYVGDTPNASQRGLVSADQRVAPRALRRTVDARGAIIAQTPDGSLINSDRIGYVVVAPAIVSRVAIIGQKAVAERPGGGVVKGGAMVWRWHRRDGQYIAPVPAAKKASITLFNPNDRRRRAAWGGGAVSAVWAKPLKHL